MADYTLSAKITGDSNSFTSAFGKAGEVVNQLHEKTAKASAKVKDFGKNLTVMGAGTTAAITLPFAAAIKTTADFENKINKAGVIAGATKGEFKKMKDAAIELGAKTSLSAGEAADAMTEMAAKGFTANQTIAAMPGVVSAAEASGEDLALTANVITSALNGFALSADKSTHVADVMAMSANKTAAGVEDLGYAFKYAAPVANDLGISLEELAASTGIMVNAGLAGSQAGTTLRTAMLRLVKPSDAAAATMEKLNFTAVDSNGKFKDISTIVQDLSKSMKGMTDVQKEAALAQIFGTEAASGMAVLMREGASGIREMTKELENSDGASAKAAAAMKNTLSGALENLSGSIESVSISLASRLTPLIQDVAKKVADFVDTFTNLDDGLQNLIAFGALGAAAIGPLLTVFGFATMGIGALGSALAFLISPVGLIVAAIGGLSIWFANAMINSDNFRNKVISLGASFVDLVKKVQTIASAIGQMFQGNWGAGGDMLQGLLPDSTIQSIITGVSVVQGVFATFMSFMRSAFSTLSPIISSAFQSIGPIFQQIFGGLGSVIQTIVPIVTGFFTSLLDGFASVGGNGSGAISSLITTLLGLNPIVKIVIGLFTVMGPQIIGIFTQILSSVGPLLQTLGGALGQIAGIISTVLTQAFATLAPVIMQIATAFLNIITTVLPVVTSLFNQLVPVIMQLATMFASVVTQLMPLVGVLISSLLPVITTIITVVMNLITSLMPSIIAIINVIMSVIQALLPVIISIVTIVVQVVATIISAIQPIIAFIGMVISAIMAIITPIIVFVANVIASIIGAITPIIQVISGIFTTAFSIIMSIFRGIYNFISTIINSISSVISNLTGVVGGVFNSIYSVASSVMSRVGSFISKVFTGIQNAWNGLTSFVSGVFDGVSSAVQSLVSQVKGFINGVIGGINSAIGIINKIPGVKIGKIPQLQSGTSSFSGGMARMNEGGRGEMVILPSGSQVIPHDATMKYAKESAKNMSGGNQTVVDFDTSNIEKWLKIIANKELIIDEDSIVNTANNGIAKKVRSYPKGGG